ncbi:MAG: hypothetical protein LBE71_02980, partial [Dysgonamonadaceae bacterium]|nr:hypothetical protein [Dysgonamonadaceae bacterium]
MAEEVESHSFWNQGKGDGCKSVAFFNLFFFFNNCFLDCFTASQFAMTQRGRNIAVVIARASPEAIQGKNRNAPNASTAPHSITLDRKLTVVSPF